MRHQRRGYSLGNGAPAAVGERASIVVVDDTPANLTLLSQILGQKGYQVRPIPEGPLALAAAQADPPDLILLDIRMPGMDGYQVCEGLKADARTSDIPVIFISALDATDDKVRAFQAGGMDYVTKPFQAEEVLARIETHLAIRSLQRQLQSANDQMAQELSLAGEVQASFLPGELPTLSGWQLAATLLPARQASGDFYDLIALPEGQLDIVMADVSDKGAGAALFMALSCTLIRTYAQLHATEPERALGAANHRMLTDTQSRQFVTVFSGILDPASGQLVFSNAGHPPPLLFRAGSGGEAERLCATGIPLGILEGWRWERDMVQVHAGDVLVLYTDGITEAHREAAELFGEHRLVASVEAQLRTDDSRERTAERILQSILADVKRFSGDAPRADDIALMVLLRS